jgi:CBS domain containing-hemolysin-like protein
MLLTLYIALAIGVSFICSILEAVLLSLTPAYVAVYRQAHPRRGRTLAELHGNIERPLAAILSLNTVSHTVGAAGAGAEAARIFGSAAIGVFSALLTLAILLFSEIIPKTLGAVYWRNLTPVAVVVLPVLVRLLLPLVWLSGWITTILQSRDAPRTSRAEIAAMAEIGAADGAIEGRESALMKHLLRFREVELQDVMTPLSVVGSLDQNWHIDEQLAASLPFSRIPIYTGVPERITGYVMRDDLLENTGRERCVGDIARGILRFDATVALPEALDTFIAQREKIAAITGEGDTMVGIATLEDVLETLIGMDIVDEGDLVADMRALARERAATFHARHRNTPPER